MTKHDAHLYLPLIEALSKGKTIQVNIKKEWHDVPDVVFDRLPHSYRVKPEPFEGWINIYPAGCGDMVHKTKSAADVEAAPDRIRCIRVIEVAD